MDSWASERLTKLTSGPNQDSSTPTRTCSSKNTETLIDLQPSHPPIKFSQNSTTRMDTNSSSENNISTTDLQLSHQWSFKEQLPKCYQKRHPPDTHQSSTYSWMLENEEDRKRRNYLNPNCLEDTSPCLRRQPRQPQKAPGNALTGECSSTKFN